MIFERRAYQFRPGMIEAFWKAQEDWNTPDVYGVVLDHNLSYFSTVAGPTDQVIQLYRFQSLDHWRACYEQYYRTQKLDYFQLVRPCMIRQENGFYIAPPVAELAEHFTAEKPRLPERVAAAAVKDPGGLCVVETMMDFFPGGLVAYWEAARKHGIASEEMDRPHRMAVLVSLVGRIHRVIQYHGFSSMEDAQRHKAKRNADAGWRDFTESYQRFVADTQTAFLRPAPIPRMRTLFRSE